MDQPPVTPLDAHVETLRPIYVGAEVRVKFDRPMRQALQAAAQKGENASKVARRLLREVLLRENPGV